MRLARENRQESGVSGSNDNNNDVVPRPVLLSGSSMAMWAKLAKDRSHFNKPTPRRVGCAATTIIVNGEMIMWRCTANCSDMN